jgi:hypothetical protein
MTQAYSPCREAASMLGRPDCGRLAKASSLRPVRGWRAEDLARIVQGRRSRATIAITEPELVVLATL